MCDQREKWVMFFDEADVLQRLPAGPIPKKSWIPNSSQDVQAYLKKISHPMTEEYDHRGKVIARKTILSI
jgi:hypothetical protein